MAVWPRVQTPMLNEQRLVDLMAILLEDPGCDIGLLSNVPEAISLNMLPKGEGHSEACVLFTTNHRCVTVERATYVCPFFLCRMSRLPGATSIAART